METWLIYLLAGGFAGLTSGLFGIGGGVVVVSVLLFVFGMQEVPQAVRMHLAVGTSLATIVITALSSVRAHHKLGGILWPVFRRLAAGLVIGVVLGAVIADVLSGSALQRVFAVFMVAVCLQMLFGGAPAPHRQVPGRAGLMLGGGVIGTFSSMLGIGGGSLTVPYLAWHGVPMRQAVGTAAAGGLPISLAGAASFVVTGWGEAGLPAGATGYVYWPAVLGIVLMSALIAPVGAKLAHRLPQLLLKRVFAGFLLLIAVRLLLG
ncbi:sulfite exporter TauE/SafE family protein [Alkalilimnicola sp. S0819]|uniref:sulfite exporter TauE/SafE family protein n=1 Tax=Alkalilimnicola sp. S0819 TaxID=2613922 RepID=UPI001262288B|nr:sulfite exporter TauE/SafE family protein [Alkalilimnicola sp. S0819]KAB7627309.1 sulfite exporter TauE/SafE family protein [Alkalilimnicola sp. S0819]MPQ16024.1 TSUP family transporter [Alkalilimnicola sp. S0819]